MHSVPQIRVQNHAHSSYKGESYIKNPPSLQGCLERIAASILCFMLILTMNTVIEVALLQDDKSKEQEIKPVGSIHHHLRLTYSVEFTAWKLIMRNYKQRWIDQHMDS